MSLPKISHPIYTFTIPSTKKSMKFRPYVSREEKLLLIAKQSDTPKDFLTTVLQIINNCAIDPLNVDTLTTYDAIYLYIKLYAQSVSNILNISYKDGEDEKVYAVRIDLNKIEVEYPKDFTNKIKFDDWVIQMKQPSANLGDELADIPEGRDLTEAAIVKCIEKVFVGDEVYTKADMTEEELYEMVDDLSVETKSKIDTFFKNLPKIDHVETYTNSKGTLRTLRYQTLSDFFL